jgi:redox-sensitive bicupin YhaK (pirin superfamily)
MRADGVRLHGIQSWIALPLAHEDDAPAFYHHDIAALPRLADTGIEARLIVGHAYGSRSPVATDWSMFYADVALHAGARLPLPDDHAERAAYLIDGEVEVAGEAFAAPRLLVFRPGDRITFVASRPARMILLGGEPMDGARHVWWNFVHSSKDRIEAAKADWRAGRFEVIPGDDREFIPLPE